VAAVPGFAMPHLIERHAAVGGVLAGEAQDSLADHIPCHLGGSAADAGDLPAQVADTDVEQSRVVLDHGRRARDGVRGVGLDIGTAAIDSLMMEPAAGGNAPSATRW
jgi:hypothetical protein